jgi:hypothetical protein
VRPRSANEWRAFWRDGGETELRRVLRETWPPAATVDEEQCAWLSTRVATLLGSNAPARALAAELGRIRAHELAAAPDREADAEAASRLVAWFLEARLAS